MLITIILGVVILLLALLYLKGIYNQYYWKKRGVPFFTKSRSGPFWDYAFGKRSMFEIFRTIYLDHENDANVGLGGICDQALYTRDPQNVHYMTQTDFHSFSHRGIVYSEEDLLANNLLFLNGPKWKVLRQKMTPLFTAAKLKNMYYIIDKSAQDFVDYLNQNPEKLKGEAEQFHDTITHFCTAAISAAVFGIGTESTFDSPFRKMVVDAIAPSTALGLKLLLSEINESLFKACKFKVFGNHEKFFVGAMRQVIKQREEEGGGKRHDFADMCVKLQKEGKMRDPDTGYTLEPTVEVLSAQAFFFFVAGIDPCAASIFTTMMELGKHPDIQKRVHKEVDAIFEKYENKLTYDSIFEAEYLDRVFSENLRMYPPIGYISRQCVKDSVLPVGNVPVQKGVKVYIPIYDFHHDPKYFPNPDVFDPDRFSKEEEINDNTYIPFGKGYRLCVGARYARLQVMSGLMHFLKHYSVHTTVKKGGIKYIKEPAQVRVGNVFMEFIPRN